MKTLNRDIESWDKMSPWAECRCGSSVMIGQLLSDAKHDIAILAAECEALRAELAALKAKPARKAPTARKGKAEPSPLPKPGRFTMRCPDETWVSWKAITIGAPIYEDGPSSPDLTRAYVAEFERRNNLKPTTTEVEQ